jgi:two-component system phosphate regulon response regulator OmpR
MNNLNYKILVIDDDSRLRVLIGRFLEENGFFVLLAKDTSEAKLLMAVNQFDLLIVDVMMPNQNGLEFTKDLRLNSNIPVIMLTARGEQDDRIKGLEVGADDYLPKPFEPKELLLRINNILKRISSNKISFEKNDRPNLCKFGDFIFNFQDSRLNKDQSFIHLTESEAKILKILCQEQGKSVSREKLSKLCGEIDDRSIDVQITRIRRKIEVNPKKPQFLQTVRNHGYILYK